MKQLDHTNQEQREQLNCLIEAVSFPLPINSSKHISMSTQVQKVFSFSVCKRGYGKLFSSCQVSSRARASSNAGSLS